MDEGGVQVPDEARRYALEELCRRAGMSDEDSRRSWKIDIVEDRQTLCIRAADPPFRRIEFHVPKGELRPELMVRKGWPFGAPSHLTGMIPEFVVPYARHDSMPDEPLFLESALGHFHCTEDLLASMALVLSRYEELDPPQRDGHGRFEAAASMAARGGYLERPIIDEYGLALRAVMQRIMPGWQPRTRGLRVKVSHDIDEIGIPFSLRNTAVQLIVRQSIVVGMRDLMSGFADVEPGSLRQVMEVCLLAEERGLRSTLYWKTSDAGPYDSGYSLGDPRIEKIIAWARNRNIEMGVHPGYETYLSLPNLRKEVDRCKTAVKGERIGGRQHYLRWRPETWAHWEQCGLAYDSTVGYADRVGFRAGTCVPYFPWLWKEGRRADLLEIPLVVMDRTMVSEKYMAMSPDASVATLRMLMRRCEAVGGVLTLLWHNNCLGRPFSAYFPRIFDTLSGTENYDWEADIAAMRRSNALSV